MDSEKVALVFDAQYGDKLESLATKVPVWIVSSEVNEPAVERSWRSHPGRGVTKLNTDWTAPVEPQALLSLFETIELHHGPYSSTQPVKTIRVMGLVLSDRLCAALKEHGYIPTVEPDGFRVELTAKSTSG